MLKTQPSLLILVTCLAAACGKTTGATDSRRIIEQPDAASTDGSVHMPDAAVPPDSATRDICAAATSADDADAGSAPPEYCIPSCVWDLIRKCTPPGAALCHSTVNGAVNEVCDFATCWSRSERPAGSMAGQSIEIRQAGSLCVGVYWGGASPIAGYLYMDNQGSMAILGKDGQTAKCDLKPGDPLVLEPGRAECKRWSLPAVGPLLPDFPCAKTVPGPCETAP